MSLQKIKTFQDLQFLIKDKKNIKLLNQQLLFPLHLKVEWGINLLFTLKKNKKSNQMLRKMYQKKYLLHQDSSLKSKQYLSHINKEVNNIILKVIHHCSNLIKRDFKVR